MLTYNIQLAGYPYEKYDEKGETNGNDFIAVFETFPWLEQLDSYDQIRAGCSATITLNSAAHNKSCWISIAGDRKKYLYLIGYVYLKLKKGLFGFGKEKIVKWVDIYETTDKDKIKSLIKLFSDEGFDQFSTELNMLKKYDSMEAYVPIT
ncbi:MAG: hypothetical protein ABIQ31_17255 [Ferruginibacter sp.]